ncbi:MAG: energy transducer TonB [Bacteroidia bacterium]
MSANTRNFWILLTTFAFTFSAAQWLGSFRSHKTTQHRIVEVEYQSSCKKRKKRKKKDCTKRVEVRKNCKLHLSDTRTPSINDIIFVDREPKAVNLDFIRRKANHAMPTHLANKDGLVIVRVLVDEFGDYRDHKVIQRSHPVMSDQVEKYIKSLEFLPARRDGKAVPFWINIPFRFRYPS